MLFGIDSIITDFFLCLFDYWSRYRTTKISMSCRKPWLEVTDIVVEVATKDSKTEG